MGGTVFKMTPTGTLTTLVNFKGIGVVIGDGATNAGSYPLGNLIRTDDGSFYGTTWSGGASNKGTVFKVTPAGSLTTLVEFTDNGANNKGAGPSGSLILGADGEYYGTTVVGGSGGLGTIYKMTPGGTLTTLVEFTGNGTTNKGAKPRGGLTLATDGNFYGTTSEGGSGGAGTAFRMAASGELTTLAEFTQDGSGSTGSPSAVTKGPDGNFYGITIGGGSNGDGTVFKATPTGTISTLAEFSANGPSTKGVAPSGSLTLGSDGNFYGMTPQGGTADKGTLFRVTPAGLVSNLIEFTGNGAINKGAFPVGSLVLGPNAAYYGMTRAGGSGGGGTIFKMTAAGDLSTLVEFVSTDLSVEREKGVYPCGSLTLGQDGSFYGMTSEGGTSELGTIFKVTSAGLLTKLVDFSGNEPGY